MPSLHRVYEKVKKSGLEILLINIREPLFTVKAAVKQRGYSIPVLLDRHGATTQDYGVWATPAVYLIDSNGYVIAGGMGPHNWDSPAGIRVLKSLGE